jgi:uncharacterized protein YcfJ
VTMPDKDAQVAPAVARDSRKEGHLANVAAGGSLGLLLGMLIGQPFQHGHGCAMSRAVATWLPF